jgi:hypothetical protein
VVSALIFSLRLPEFSNLWSCNEIPELHNASAS